MVYLSIYIYIYIYTKTSIYEDIGKIIKNDKYANEIEKFVYCIDINERLKYNKCSFYNDKAKYLVYFDSITTQNSEKTKKYPDFIKAFCRLEKHAGSNDVVRSNFDKLGLKNVDFCLFTLLKEWIFSKEKINLTQTVENEIKKRGDGTIDMNKLAKATFLVYYHNMLVEDAAEKAELSSNQLLLLPIKYKIFSQFLIALNYVNIIKNIKSEKNLTTEDKRALNQLYDDDITRFIVEYMKENIAESNVINFEKNYYKKLDFTGKSTLTYVIGKIVGDENNIMEILKREEDDLKKSYNKKEKGLKERSLYEYYVAKRSIEIGMTRNDKDYRNKNTYIIRLLNNKNERRINRGFYLEFYGDRLKKERFLGNEVIFLGHDFYNTYHTLAFRIEEWLTKGVENGLNRIELFTLCDLIQVRLDNEYITYRRERNELIKEKYPSTKSLFYNEEYYNVSINIINFAEKMIDLYVSQNSKDIDLDLFLQYLLYEKEIFSKVKDSLARNSSDYDFDYKKILSTLIKLKDTKKTGWHFANKKQIISQEDMNKVFNDIKIYESVLEHTYESYIIGLLYLPNEDINDSKYNKQEVLNMILIHDLGETVVGDYPPSFENYSEILEKEKNVCRGFYFAGQHPEYATLIDYQRLWNEWFQEQSKNINVCIAKEIDKIQMLYKLLTIIYQSENDYENDRFINFFESAKTILTPQGKHIYNILIANNPSFIEIAKKHGYEIVER